MTEFAPNWYSHEALQTVKKGYLQPNENVFDMYWRLASTASNYYVNGLPNITKSELCSALYHVFCQGWLSPASPVAANFGSEKGMPCSCYGLNPANSIDDIFLAMHEGAMLSKNGGGLGINLSNLKGTSSVTTWAKGYDYMAKSVSQGGVRRGAVALYIDIDHPDILPFLMSKDLLKGDHREKLDCNIAVILDKEFMQRLYGQDLQAIDLFSQILELRLKTGSPYIMFKHNAQANDPECYKANNLKTEHSQLCCLPGDTMVLTGKGPKPISQLCNKLVTIWDGYQWVKNQNFEYKGQTDLLVNVQLADLTEISMTINHRCYLADGSVVLANDLMLTDKLQTIGGSIEIVDIDVIELDGPIDVYCTTVPTTQKFALANGVITGNSEIFLHSDENITYSCMLSSLNLDKYFEWASWSFNGYSLAMLGIIFLDAVNQEFIQKGKTKKGLAKAVRGAEKGRALGLGTLGLHNLYMQQGLAFESEKAYALNIEIHKQIKQQAVKASQILAKELGEPEWCKGFGMRNTHLLAIAPTTTNSVLCNAGTPGIEPQISNYFVMAGAKGSFIRQNKYLANLLAKVYGENAETAWQQIKLANGSVQGLAKLSDKDKAVFKTAYEIDQKHIVQQAADRQKYICQGQSLNLFFYANADSDYIVNIHLLAEKLGLKSLYYVRSTSAMNSAIVHDKLNIAVYSRPDCKYCKKAKALLNDLGLPYAEYFKPEGRVPEIWIDGEELPDGYTSLNQMFEPQSVLADSNLLPSTDCTSCEG